MKFLCDNCKAKYQIADEKVAGKTVRMKCRKCGHQIEVRAAVTETSVSTSPPQAPGDHAAPRPIPRAGLATSLSAAKPRAPSSHHPQQGGALAGAFQRTVQDPQQGAPYTQQSSALELSVTDEWYVAINGVPVGPVRISELRRKAASGAVTEDSLCWQEGLEEWRPVRSIPELAAIVREAAQGNRPSLIAPQPNEGRASSPPRPPTRPSTPARSPEPPRGDAFGPRPAATFGPARSNVVPLRVAASSTSDDGPAMTAPHMGGAAPGTAAAIAPFNAPAPAPQLWAPAPAPPPPQAAAPMLVSDPFAIPPGPGAVGTSSSASIPPPAMAPFAPSMVPPQAKRGVPLWFWPILVFTGVFGVAAAVFVFRQQGQPAPVVIQLPAPISPTAAPPPTAEVPPPTPSTEPSAAEAAPTGKVASAGAPRTGGGPAPTEKKGLDVSGLLSGTGGPSVGGGPSPTQGGGGGLDSSSVERVVASHRSGVKRTCWERGGADKKTSVNVTVSATVAPDGHVARTSSSGDDPVIAKCIESQVKSWRFNAPGATTTVNIPFKFVRQ